MYTRSLLILIVFFFPIITAFSQDIGKGELNSIRNSDLRKNTKTLPFRLRSLPNVSSMDDTGKVSTQPLIVRSKRLEGELSNQSKNIPSQSMLSGEVHEAWVRQYASNALPSDDYANAIVTDQLGNVIVTGVSYATYSGADYFTVKYNSKGDTLWTRRYNGVGNDYDEATAVGVDPSGNVYVTGYSFGENNGFDVVTVKYTSDGKEEWVREYYGAADSNDVGVTLAVDNAGNVIIAGYGYQSGTGDDILTIKYNTSGVEQWVRYYNGTANDDDRATALCFDSYGSVYVTGYSTGIGTGKDYLTIKYDANGTELWSDRYMSPLDGPDIATSIVVDAKGECYVTGSSFRSGEQYNYLTIKYDSFGGRDWIASYNDSLNGDDVATALDIDSSGNVYVTGWSYSGNSKEDFLTISYDMFGQQRWTARYNDPQNLSDAAVDLTVDALSSKLYVTGWINYSQGKPKNIMTICYTLGGATSWINSYVSDNLANNYPSALTLDKRGNLYVVGSSMEATTSYDFITLKYSTNEYNQWPSRFHLGIGNNTISGMAVDHYGDIFVTGNDSSHYITVKLDSNGVAKWSAQFGSVYCYTVGLVLDDSGNVYVAGSTIGSKGNLDYATIKYNSNGVKQWESWYQGTGNGDDQAVAIAIDSIGNIYVTGTSFGIGTQNDYATIKYNSNGIQQWVARYNGIGNYNENASAISVDRMGFVYVTGTGIRAGSSYDYLTVKYNSDGNLVWEKYYNGIGNGGDFAKAMALDTDNNIYVTGRSLGIWSSSDYVTIKYNGVGVQQWIAIYNGSGNNFDDPIAIVVDRSKNIVVTGSSYSSTSNWDYATVKYDSNGVQLWSKIYDGPENGADIAADLIVDNDGNIFVTGASYGSSSMLDFATIKYNFDGIQLWEKYYNSLLNSDDKAQVVALGPGGDVLVAGSSIGDRMKSDCLVVKYSSDGSDNQLWPSRINGPDISLNYGKTLQVALSGDIYVAGTSTDPNSMEDFRFVKYTANGDQHWSIGYNGPPNNDDNIIASAIDTAGNIYATGTSYAKYAPSDYGTVKISSSGIVEWSNVYNGPANSYDFASDITIDDSSNVYVTGYSLGNLSYDYATIKYNASGIQQWVARYDGPSGRDDLAYAIALDKQGNVYVTGMSYNIGTGFDYATVKYNRDGVEQWVARYDGPSSGYDRSQSIKIDNENNIIVTGWSTGTDTTYDFATIKYDSNGTMIWVARYSAGTKTNDMAKALALDKDGNVYVTGSTYLNNLANSDYVTIKYNKAGIKQWDVRYNGPANADDQPSAIAVDDFGSVYVTGKSIGQDLSSDFATIKYNSAGGLEWIARYNACHRCDDYANALALDNDNNLYVTGTSKSSDWSVISTIKYSQTSTSVQNDSIALPLRFHLSQNYPNPFNPRTVIQYTIEKRSYVSLKIYNLLGQEIIKLVDEIQDPGVKEVALNATSLPSGIYFYQIKTSNGFSDMKKMLLLK